MCLVCFADTERVLDERSEIADRRDQLADERQRLADERDELADRRDADATARERRLLVWGGSPPPAQFGHPVARAAN
jgi:hypothetical protein